MTTAAATNLMQIETGALLSRIDQVRPFSLHLPMVMAAAPSQSAWSAIENYLASGRRKMRRLCRTFLAWLRGPGSGLSDEQAQRRFAMLRLQVLSQMNQFDIFADALVQRSQHGFGEWLGGLDVVAEDALRLNGDPYPVPPVICYLDRGHGAAIRRARTRLPGGGDNPCAIIRVPRERMIGSGIASSLIHEVGHQAAALLDVVTPLRLRLQERTERADAASQLAWKCLTRWISEIFADFWSVANVGIGSTQGLIGVVSLPRAFVFRVTLDDPHPAPWIRVKISAAMGARLHPDPQWSRLTAVWQSLYPTARLDAERKELFGRIEASLPEFVEMLCGHRPPALKGGTIEQVLPLAERSPARLRGLFTRWRADPAALIEERPTVAMGVAGQAKADGLLSSESEGRMVGRLLRFWAYSGAVDTAWMCAQARQQRGVVAQRT